MARMNVRQMWAAKLAGKEVPATTHSRVNTADVGLNFGRKPPFAGVVLGIDPSLRGTGLALVEFAQGRSPLLLRCQTVKVHPKLPMPGALAEIHRAVTAMLAGAGVRVMALPSGATTADRVASFDAQHPTVIFAGRAERVRGIDTLISPTNDISILGYAAKTDSPGRTGDDGSTGLGDGSRIDKDALRVQAMGDVDELNAAMGLAHAWWVRAMGEIVHRLVDLERRASLEQRGFDVLSTSGMVPRL